MMSVKIKSVIKTDMHFLPFHFSATVLSKEQRGYHL